jgi:hypothetical protein
LASGIARESDISFRGELQAGVEQIRARDPNKAAQIESWINLLEGSYHVLPMDSSCFREWARLMHGMPDNLLEDAMIAATARIHQLTVAREMSATSPSSVWNFSIRSKRPVSKTAAGSYFSRRFPLRRYTVALPPCRPLLPLISDRTPFA